MGRHGRGATKTWPGGEFGDAEESTQSRVAVARTDGRTSAISTSLYWAPLFARLHKRREPKTGRLIFRQRAEGRGKLAPLKSWAVSRWQRSKKGGAELREGGR